MLVKHNLKNTLMDFTMSYRTYIAASLAAYIAGVELVFRSKNTGRAQGSLVKPLWPTIWGSSWPPQITNVDMILLTLMAFVFRLKLSLHRQASD